MSQTPSVDLMLPPGMHAVGTKSLTRGTWGVGSMVRWYDGALQPIGGFLRAVDKQTGAEMPPLFANATFEAVRTTFQWADNSNRAWLAVGTNRALYVVDESNTAYRITPSGFTAQPKEPPKQTGYGLGGYGLGGYGTTTDFEPLLNQPVFSWSLSSWGEDLIAVARGLSTNVFSWSPWATGSEGSYSASELSNSPTNTQGAVVTNQRILLTVGSANDGRLVQWSDAENNNKWDFDEITSAAGFQSVPGDHPFITVVNTASQILLFSRHDVALAVYVGPPYIMGIQQIADNIRLYSPQAIATVGGAAFWWGSSGFWIAEAGQVQPIPCPVFDYLKADMNHALSSKTHASINTQFHEIWWYYVSKNSSNGETDKYVVFNYSQNTWYFGELARGGAVDALDNRPVLMIDHAGCLYLHELTNVGVAHYCVTNPIQLDRAGRTAYLQHLLPDLPYTVGAHAGAINTDCYVELTGYDRPNGSPVSSRKERVSELVPLTGVSGKYITLRLEGQSPRWRFGLSTLHFTLGGIR